MDQSDSVFLQHLSLANVVTTLLLSCAASVLISSWRAPRYPTSIPWVGNGKGWLAAVKNLFGAISGTKEWVYDGYEKYNKNGQSFVLPATLGSPAEVVIPRSHMQWMLDQPDSVLSTSAAHYDLLAGDYSFVEPIILEDPYHEHVIHKNLARNLNSIIPDLNDEICKAVDDFFGMNRAWHSVNVLNSFMILVPRLTNRMLVGEPLCRNQDYLNNMLAFTNDVIRGFLLFPLTPKFLHPIVGAVHSLGPKYHAWRTSKHTLPIIRDRLNAIKKKDAGDSAFRDVKEPNDFITWSIRTALAEGRHDECDPWRIAIRILPINFASIHTTSMTGQQAILDILSADPGVLQELREEATRIYREDGDQWTKQGLARMYKMDSAIRESQRLSAIALTFVHRKVMQKPGIRGPDGTFFEYGTLISCPWKPSSADEDLHKAPDAFDAFRYSREREAFEIRAMEDKDRQEGLKLKQNALVTTSETHLPFSHGRHACPGRFFVAHELKMLFAYLFINYDIKHLDERPKSLWIGRSFVPATKACIELKRKG